VVAALLLVELALRLAGFEFALLPTRVQFGWPDPVTLRRLYEPDRDLLWVPRGYREHVAAMRGRAPSLVFMGDSCTQFGTYDRDLAALLRARLPGEQLSFVNVGVGGWSSWQGLRQLRRDVLPMLPRVVTIYYGWNDHWSSFGLEDRQIGAFTLRQPAAVIALSHLRVVQLVNRALFTLEFPAAGRAADRPARVPLPEFAGNIAAMVREARAAGVVPVLLTAPTSQRRGREPAYLDERWLENLADLVPLHERYADAVRAVAAAEGAPLVDLAAEFSALPDEELAQLFRRDGIHPTPEGDRRIAASLLAHLERDGLLERLVAPP